MKKTRAWAIWHWDDGLYVNTVRRTREETIEAFKQQFNMGDEKWVEDRRAGLHRAVRVTIERETRQ